ncbi:MAG: hypothetical protein ACOYL3_23220 [Desulfuromonadaceae bacterium]
MKLFVIPILIACLFSTIHSLAATEPTFSPPAVGKNYNTFIPKGWFLLSRKHLKASSSLAFGDLNHDGINDVVMVISDTKADESGISENSRKLVILLGEKLGGYRFSGAYEKVLLCQGCGGQGDPFSNIQIIRGVIVVKHSGGSGNNRWDRTHKWQLRDQSWYLIGHTSRGYFDEISYTSETNDDNFLTGKRIITKIDHGKKTILKSNVQGLRPLKMNSFDIDID